MATRDLSDVFLLNLTNRDFAAGAAPYNCANVKGRAALLATMSKAALGIGAVWTLVTLGVYFFQEHAKSSIAASVRTVTASVSGCEGPGRFQNIRFRYTANGVAYDQNAYIRQSAFIGDGGLIVACETGSVKLNYLAGDPNRWSIAPLSPITRDELNAGLNAGYLAGGPMLWLLAGIFGGVGFLLRKEQTKQERLRDRGVLLEAQVVKFEDDNGESSPYNYECEYSFVTPQGAQLTGKGGALRHDIKKKNLPPAGTRLLVLYVDDQLHRAL